MQSTKGTALNMHLLRRVFTYVQPYRKRFWASVVLAILLAVFAPIRPLLIQISINEGLSPNGTGWWLEGPGAFLVEITIIQIVLLLAETATRFYFTFWSASLGQNVVKDLRVKTYKKILSLELRQYDKTPIGTLTTRTINDIESVNDIFSDGLIPILADLLAIFSILGYMFYTDWLLTLVCLLPFPFLILATYYFKESVNRSFTRVRNAVASLNAFVQEHLSGMQEVQSFAAEEKEMKRFQKINADHRNANVRAIFAYSVFFPVVELISALSIGLLVWWAGREYLGSEAGAHVGGVVTAFILCLNLLFRPLRVLADKFNVMQMGMIASERVFRVLDNEDVTPNPGQQRFPVQGAVRFENVVFSYDGITPVLNNISFSIPAGKTLAIVGTTGSGKTSLISLINRLYPVQQGRILIDEHPLESFDLEYLRSRIGVVLQDVFLFSGSIRDNLTLHNPNISDEQLIRAAKMVGLHPLIEKLPGGYDFKVMERGSTLSMGQRQLLSFARALLYDPAILILDEATASVDPESERLIQEAINTLVSGRTSIVIAHRLSTIRKADQIMVLSGGKVLEMGDHATLLQKNGAYADLYAAQAMSDEAN